MIYYITDPLKVPLELQNRILLEEADILTASPLNFTDIYHLFRDSLPLSSWEQYCFNLFPNIKIFFKPPPEAGKQEAVKFWRKLINDAGTQFLNSLDTRRKKLWSAFLPKTRGVDLASNRDENLKRLYKAIYRNDLAATREILNNQVLLAKDLYVESSSITTDEFELPGMSPLLVASRLKRQEILDAFYQWAPKSTIYDEVHWISLFNQHQQLKSINEDLNWNLIGLNGRSILWYASQNGHHQLVDFLLNKGIFVDHQYLIDVTPLWIASQYGQLAVVKALLAKGAAVDKSTVKEGASPLYIACQNGHLAVAEELIRAGANVNGKLRDNEATPLYIACQNGHDALVDLLIKSGADFKMPCTKEGITPIFTASYFGFPIIVKQLAIAGVDVNAGTSRQLTPLGIAISNGHLTVVKELIQYGANVSQPSQRLPHQMAASRGHKEMARLLKMHATMKSLDEASVLQLFQRYCARESGRFFDQYNKKQTLVRQALIGKQTLEAFLLNLKHLADEQRIALRAPCSGRLNAIIHLAEMVFGMPFEQLGTLNKEQANTIHLMR